MSCDRSVYRDTLNPETSLSLKWNKAFDDDSVKEGLYGLKWTLSFVGATLPKRDPGIYIDDNIITIDIEKLGFTSEAQRHLRQLHDSIKVSGEYQTNQHVDLGRYVSLLLGSSQHYYALTGMPNTFEDLLGSYKLGSFKGYVTNSGVSREHRIISYSQQNGFHQLFLSTEIDSISGEILEYETVDILPNGQPRFGIFDLEGNLKISSDPKHSNGGKPSKCIWCHESGIQPLFKTQRSVSGYLSYPQLQDTLKAFKASHNELKEDLNDGVNYAKKQRHTTTELLYISFMEPSAHRLSLEWGIPETEIKKKLAHLKTHVHHEFPFLGALYYRKDVAAHAPFKGLPVSGSIREPSEVEVNYMNIGDEVAQ